MKLFGKTKTGDGVKAIVGRRLARWGIVKAFVHNGLIMLSSGPMKEYLEDIDTGVTGNLPVNNTIRSEIQAHAFNATRIVDTFGGKFVFQDHRLYKHFNKTYPPMHGKPSDESKKHSRVVETFISCEFIKAVDGHFFTAVCGADKKRVFYEDETRTMMEVVPALIAALMKEKDIKTLNGVPIEKFRKMYNPADYDRTYRYICLTEQRLLLHYSRSGKATAPYDALTAFNDYLYRKEFYQLERRDTYSQSGETFRYKDASGSYVTAKKCDRPVYTMNKMERFNRRQEAMKKEAVKYLRNVLAALSVKKSACRPAFTALSRPVNPAP